MRILAELYVERKVFRISYKKTNMQLLIAEVSSNYNQICQLTHEKKLIMQNIQDIEGRIMQLPEEKP